MNRLVLFAIWIFSLAACAPTLKMEQHSGEIDIHDEELPRQVVILPFANETEEPGLDTVVRRNFANHFSSKAYLDTKIPVVDEKLIHWEKSSGKAMQQATPQEISAALGADGLLYGKVTDYKRVYAGLYSQFGIEAEVWMVNARTGKEVFRHREAVRYHEGGIPTSPLSIVVTAVSTGMNLREIQKVRMVNELCYKFMEKIPSPKTLSSNARPVIKEALTNAAEGPFGLKSVIKAGLEGEPGLVATFDIGNFKKGIPMKEDKPGIYTGEYAVMPGDATRDMPVSVTLSRPGGYETQWGDVLGYITVDTTPPPPATGLRAKGYPDRVELSWEGAKSTPDLKGYRVLRSDSPLSGYGELALVEVESFADRGASAGKSYYYRVVSVDKVGNEAEPSGAMRGAIVTGEPQKLSGELKEDAVLEGTYLITAPLTVPKGTNLTISGGSVLLFLPQSGLHVRGRLTVTGGETPVEFAPSGEEKWGGITLEGARATLTRFTLRGAVVGISSKDSETVVEGGLVSGCETGLAISGMSPVELKAMTVSENLVGLKLAGTAAKVSSSHILQNKEGIVAEGFSGEIRDNNILDNGSNIRAEKPLAVAANWFGTVQADGMKLGNVTAYKVYDARVPGGAVVLAVADPYAQLSSEERQKKSAELVIEAGSYFRQRNYGKATTLFAENLKVLPGPETYYYISLCYSAMNEPEKSLAYLQEGTAKYPQESVLWKALGMLSYERGDESTAKRALEECLRLSPDDRQARFVLDRLKGGSRP
ncbi:MAG TPA: hypothetical protein DCZ75_18725 [Geobacter sp.]|nr:hypothetical protein [Geobacter sp.]